MPVVGSSRKRTLGRLNSSVATLVRLRWPPEREPTRVSACSSSDSSPQDAIDGGFDLLPRGVLREAEPRRVAQRLSHRQEPVHDVVLGNVADVGEAGRQILPVQGHRVLRSDE